MFTLAATAQVHTVLYSFQSGNDGALPTSNLISDGAGGFYGMTHSGGSSGCGGYGCGTFFHLTHSGGVWTNTVLIAFGDKPDLDQPDFELIKDSAGNFYGTSEGGGTDNWGTVFEISPPSQPGGAWTETILYSFTDGLDGGDPQGGVTFGPGGALYGTTVYGGPFNTGGCYPYGCGVVFQLLPPAKGSTTWTEASLYNFSDIFINSGNDMKLIADRQGRLFGTTQNLGRFGAGTVFMLTPPSSQGGNWTTTDIYDFTGGADGANPLAGLIFDRAGNLYGTTNGNAALLGTVFELSPPSGSGSWAFKLLHTFVGTPSDGDHPQTRLTFDNRGNLYGTTYGGGITRSPKCFILVGCGTIFELSPTSEGVWNETVLHEFGGGDDGLTPEAPVTIMGNGLIFGTTWIGGTADQGTVFVIRP